MKQVKKIVIINACAFPAKCILSMFQKGVENSLKANCCNIHNDLQSCSKHSYTDCSTINRGVAVHFWSECLLLPHRTHFTFGPL